MLSPPSVSFSNLESSCSRESTKNIRHHQIVFCRRFLPNLQTPAVTSNRPHYHLPHWNHPKLKGNDDRNPWTFLGQDVRRISVWDPHGPPVRPGPQDVPTIAQEAVLETIPYSESVTPLHSEAETKIDDWMCLGYMLSHLISHLVLRITLW